MTARGKNRNPNTPSPNRSAMTSKGGKREYYCGECQSGNTVRGFTLGLIVCRCMDCGHWVQWRNRKSRRSTGRMEK